MTRPLEPVPRHLLSIRGQMLLFSAKDEAEFFARLTAKFPVLWFFQSGLRNYPALPERWYRSVPEVPGADVSIEYLRPEHPVEFVEEYFRKWKTWPGIYPTGVYRRFHRFRSHPPADRLERGVLYGQALDLAGRAADAEDMAFVDGALRILRKFATNKLSYFAHRKDALGPRVLSRVTRVWAGPDAVRWCREDRARVLKDPRNYTYVPPDE